MKNKALKTILIVALIIALTIADFVLVGTKLVTYALEDIGVKFNAYFKSEEGEETPEIEYEIDNQEMKLCFEISVESGVSFDGVITLSENANFKLKDGLSQGISKIEGNKIILETIRTGNTAKIEVGIEPVVQEDYGEDMLSKESTLTLSGNYDDGTDSNKSINLEEKVRLTLTPPANIETSLNGKIITNKSYQLGEETKKIVQIELSSAVLGNVYPIEETTFEVSLPKEVEGIEVITKGTYATNGEADRVLIENTNYMWDKVNNKLQISIKNTSKDSKISWKQNAIDNVIVTLILPETVNTTAEEYNVTSKIKLYGQEESLDEKTLNYNLAEEADEIIRASIHNNEDIYKGKIYSREEREYTSTTNIEVNYANLIQGVTIKEKNTYRKDITLEDLTANIEYKTTTISKSEFDKVLGETGSLLIKDQSGNTVKEVKSTDFATDGKLIITYASGVKELTIEMTKAIGSGVIRLEHTKVIKTENYTEEEIDSIKYLVEQGEVIYNTQTNKFGIGKDLKDVTSQVALTVPETISAEGNKEISMSITLKTDNEKYELFENPIFIVTMPEGVTVNSVSDGADSTLYGGLEISKLEVISNKEIEIALTGKQTEYIESNINSQINFKANVSIEKLMPNKVDSIKMQYQNKGNTYNIESEKINVIASNTKLLTHVKVENYNGSGEILERYSNNTTEITGELPVGNTEEIEMTVIYTIINNYAQDIVASMAAVDVNYTNYEGNKTDLLTEIEQDVEVKAGEMKQISKTVKIPAELYYGEKIDLATLLECTYSGTLYKVRNDIGLETEGKEGLRDITIIDDKIQVETFAQLGDGSGVSKYDEVYNEQIISYIIEVTNISNETISNIIVKNKQDNGNIYDLKEIEIINYAVSGETVIEHVYAELSTDLKVFESFELKKGESIELLCRVVAKKKEENNITSANISISANGLEQQNLSQISNKVKESSIKISSRKALTEEVQMYATEVLKISNYITNLTDKEMNDIDVKLYLSEGLEFKGNTMVEVLDLGGEKLERLSDIHYNKDDNCLEFKITKLNANEIINITAYTYIKAMDLEQLSTEVMTYAKVNDVVSNNVKVNAKQIETELSVIQSVNILEGQKVKNEEIIIITGEITNKGYVDTTAIIKDDLPEGLEIVKVELKQNGQVIDKTESASDSLAYVIAEIEKGETVTIIIEAKVNTSRIILEELTNQIIATPKYGETVYSNEIIIEIDSDVDTNMGGEDSGDEVPGEQEDEYKDPTLEIPDDDKPEDDKPGDDKPGDDKPGDDKPGDDKPGDDKPEDDKPEDDKPEDDKPGDQEEQDYTISGYAWVDKNENGLKDVDEVIPNVLVKIIDIDNKNTFLKDKNGKEIEIKTDKNGGYAIKNLPKGNYNLIFKYNTEVYEIKANTGIKDYIIEKTDEKVAITNNINLEQNKTLDLILMELTEFNMKLDKYISKVIVQTANETRTSTYTENQLAREEISKKYLSGATVLVEYNIKISNIGELSGYVTEIIDYLPSDMKFYSELNKQWYIGDDRNLYNTTLSNTEIKPGESRTIKLILSKTMTPANTGTTTNIAEISGMMNTKQYVDIDMNNNKSKAEIIVNIATGTMITYIIAVLNSIAILAFGMYIIKNKVIGKEKINEHNKKI